MACQRLIDVPKVALRRLYPQASAVHSNFFLREPTQIRATLCRYASGQSVSIALPDQDSLIRRIRRKIGLTDFSPAYYKAVGLFMYEKVDTLAINDIFKEFELEDTFYSWYLVMELHLWMILSQASKYAKEGDYVKKTLGSVMWDDVRRRIKLIVMDLSVSDQSNTLKQLSAEIDFALVLYDEALLTDDKRLAEALWIRLYRAKEVDPILLEKVVCYVRKQIYHLDSIPREEFLLQAKFSWLPLKDCKI